MHLTFTQKYLFRPAPVEVEAAAKHPYQTSFQSPHLLHRAGKALSEVSFNWSSAKNCSRFYLLIVSAVLLKFSAGTPTCCSIATLLRGIVESERTTSIISSHLQPENCRQQQQQAEKLNSFPEPKSSSSTCIRTQPEIVEPGFGFHSPLIFLTFQHQAQAAPVQLRTPRLQHSLRRAESGHVQAGHSSHHLKGGRQEAHQGVHQGAPGVQGRIVYNRQVYTSNLRGKLN